MTDGQPVVQPAPGAGSIARGWARLKSWLAASFLTGWRITAVLFLIMSAVVAGGRWGLFGASRLVVEPLSAVPPGDGVLFFLPRTSLRGTLNYQIKRCAIEQRPGQNAGTATSLDAVISVDLLDTVQPDLDHGYVIRADSMGGGFWSSDITIETQNSVLKAVNSIATSSVAVPKEIRPETLLASVASSVLKSIPEDAGPAPTLEQQRNDLCGADLVRFLDKPDAKETAAPDPTKGHRELLLQFDDNCPPGFTKPTTPTTDTLVCAISGRETVGTLLARPEQAVESLNRFDIQIQVRKSAPAAIRAATASKNLVYRTGGTSLITVCLRTCSGGISGARVIGEKPVHVAQWGMEGSIPIERRLFSSMTVQLEFAATGELVKARFGDKATSTTDEKN